MCDSKVTHLSLVQQITLKPFLQDLNGCYPKKPVFVSESWKWLIKYIFPTHPAPVFKEFSSSRILRRKIKPSTSSPYQINTCFLAFFFFFPLSLQHTWELSSGPASGDGNRTGLELRNLPVLGSALNQLYGFAGLLWASVARPGSWE